MRSLTVTLLAVAALSAVAAAPAGANTLNYGDTTSTSDYTTPVSPFDFNGPTTCGSTVDPVDGAGPFPYREYAFRNASASSDCITVSGASDCSQGETFEVTGDPFFIGSDKPNTPTCQATHAHSFNEAPGRAFTEFVLSTGPGFPYTLSVQGSDVVPVHLVWANHAPLPGGNTVNVYTSSLEDGTGVDGTLTDDAGQAHHYGGPVQCLRVSGNEASLVMTFDGTERGLTSKWKGAVYWFRQSQDGTQDAQRNSLLTQQQLDGKYASCPDPATPLAPGFRTIASSHGPLTVIANGPQAT